jgi:hypothetical protein
MLTNKQTNTVVPKLEVPATNFTTADGPKPVQFSLFSKPIFLRPVLILSSYLSLLHKYFPEFIHFLNSP